MDVSKCKHYKNKNCIADYLLTDMPFSEAKCELSPNCYYKQLQQLKAENEELKNKLNKVQELLELYEIGQCDWKDNCYSCKGEKEDGKYWCSIGEALEVIRGENNE